jgi:hypothetical protein
LGFYSGGILYMHCTKCGSVVPDGAAFCPNCGNATAPVQASAPGSPFARNAEPEEPKNKKSKLLGCLGIGVGAVVLLAILGSLAPESASDGNTTAASGTAETAGELPLAVTAAQLFNAYANNEATAQGYFGDRLLLVSGTVDKVTLDFSDDPVVGLKTPNQFMDAQAALAEDAHDEAGNFNPGDKAELLCEGVSEIAGTPMLKNCRTAPPGQKSKPVEWSK